MTTAGAADGPAEGQLTGGLHPPPTPHPGFHGEPRVDGWMAAAAVSATETAGQRETVSDWPTDDGALMGGQGEPENRDLPERQTDHRSVRRQQP